MTPPALVPLPPMMTEEEWLKAKLATDREWTRITLPAGWHEVLVPPGDFMEGARLAKRGKTSLIFTAGKHDGEWWLHVSIAHPEKLPTYFDLTEVKRIFIGSDRQAIQVFPAETEHVNIHPRALHLWACLEPSGDGLPHFGRFGTI